MGVLWMAAGGRIVVGEGIFSGEKDGEVDDGVRRFRG